MILTDFIVFEGIDGAGTSTQLNLISQKLGEKVWITAEPTESPIGRLIREFLKGKFPLTENTVTRLFAADREEHIYGENGIISHLKQGKKVFCDRYFFSTYAYQSSPIMKEQNKNFPYPQHLFFFDIKPEISLARIQSRAEKEIYEKQEFLSRTCEKYRNVIAEGRKEEPGMNVHIIDATLPIEEINEKILGILF